MMTSPEGRALIETFEGLELKAYKDGNGIPTIGYGHTQGVCMGDTCTKEQANAWLSEDLRTAEHAIGSLVKAPLNQNQYDALVSLCYNIGQGHFAQSTVLRELNQGHTQQAADGFLMWNRVAGKVTPGLMNRREQERALFLKPA